MLLKPSAPVGLTATALLVITKPQPALILSWLLLTVSGAAVANVRELADTAIGADVAKPRELLLFVRGGETVGTVAESNPFSKVMLLPSFKVSSCLALVVMGSVYLSAKTPGGFSCNPSEETKGGAT